MPRILIPLLLCACATGLMRDPGESDADFADRVHAEKVRRVNNAYMLIDGAANLARANDVGSDSFWAKYDEAEKLFLLTFELWEAGDLTQGDPVDVALAVLHALSEELAEAAEG